MAWPRGQVLLGQTAVAPAGTGGQAANAPAVAASGDSPRAAIVRFSHRFHLQQVKATCADCHVAASSSATATDNLLPREKACLACHDGRKARNDCAVCHADPKQAKTFESPARTFRFSHKQHLELGDLGPIIAAAIQSKQHLGVSPPLVADLKTGNACAACHRGLERTGYATKANLPMMADCVVCHSKIEPPFSCTFCHTKEAVLKPASHTADFLEAHSRANANLDKPSCRVCHGVKFTCLGCH